MLTIIRRSVVPIAAAGALACGGDTGPTEPGPVGAEPLPVLVSGLVRDSLAGSVIADALVTTRMGHAVTDAAGRFAVLAPRGRATFRVAHPQYAFKTLERSAEAHMGITLDVAPLGPTVLGCDVRRGAMWMLVGDLQGRKTIVRRDSSGVTLGEGTARRWVVAHDFTWWALDELTWLVDGPPASADEVATAEWRLFDTDGNARLHRCGAHEVPVRPGDEL